ncbi:MAG: hypothetical protein CMD39_07380 [Gammaproteobacteria bacterium]|nr:hypothetical protein [Gammaproteobacteria bacterium]
MMLNLWECEHRGCTAAAAGTGGAVGLRAIGWYFRRGSGGSGPTILCPNHRPDASPPQARCQALELQDLFNGDCR